MNCNNDIGRIIALYLWITQNSPSGGDINHKCISDMTVGTAKSISGTFHSPSHQTLNGIRTEWNNSKEIYIFMNNI